MAGYERIVDEAEYAWLVADTIDGGEVAGFDRAGWPASVWILNAYWETDDPNYDPSTFHPGNNPWRGAPAPGWRRVRWGQVAARRGASFGGPAQKWHPRGFPSSWSEQLIEPLEGGPDQAVAQRLLHHLAAQDPRGLRTPCQGFVNVHGWEPPYRRPLIVRGSLEWILGCPDEGWDIRGQIQNVWPDDRSWFIYAGFDNCCTKVSGSQSLIETLNSDPELETLPKGPTQDM